MQSSNENHLKENQTLSQAQMKEIFYLLVVYSKLANPEFVNKPSISQQTVKLAVSIACKFNQTFENDYGYNLVTSVHSKNAEFNSSYFSNGAHPLSPNIVNQYTKQTYVSVIDHITAGSNANSYDHQFAIKVNP